MRYGREATAGDQIRLTEVVEIAPDGEADPAAWLAVYMPTFPAEGWIHVADDNASGAVKQNDGTYLNPETPPPTTTPTTLTKLEFVRICQSAGGMTGTMLVAAQENANLKEMWILIGLAEDVSRDDVDTKNGLAALDMLGYLPNGAPAVLAAWPVQ